MLIFDCNTLLIYFHLLDSLIGFLRLIKIFKKKNVAKMLPH